MPPKVDTSDPEVARLLAQFESISFTGQKANETLRNAKTANNLSALIERCGLASKSLDAKQGSLVAAVAASAPNDLSLEKRAYVVERIVDGSLHSADRVTIACKFVAGHDNIDKTQFDEACGVGAVVTPEQARAVVDEHLEKDASIEGWTSLATLMGKAKADPRLRWASSLDVKNAVEQGLEAKFGPKSKAAAPAAKAKEAKAKEAKAKEAKPEAAPAEADPDAMFKGSFLSRLHKPGENPQSKPELKAAHLSATGGRVVTRFPPEPNGFLHIGHSKAIAVDFGYARYHGGVCYLRYDDTNPSAEEAQYFESILEMVRWLGFEPFKITYSSDYFQQLYELAVELIKRGKAYVDHSTAEEIFEGRGGKERGPRKGNKYRDRPIEESLKDFEDMKAGKYPPGKVTLRMKQDLEGSGNPQMWDLIAYRVLDAPHHRTGKQWCIYPTYDFTHCLVDSFENISHSLCTTEFILSRESYEWLCDALEVYKPRQYEFGRLNLEGTITSKRKILKLVSEGHVKDWDDPRLFTLLAQRRRGVPPGAILSFVNQLGVTNAISTIQSQKLDQVVRQYLETSTPRLMMLLKPIKVVLDNVADDFCLELERPLHPKIPSMGNTKMPFAKTLFIDSSDFRAVDSPDYFRLAPGKTVGLLNAPYPITCTSFEQGANGEPSIVHARYEDPSMQGDAARKTKTYIQWVAQHEASHSPVPVKEARIFHPLFTSENPAAETNYLDHIDPNSLEVCPNAMVEVGFWEVAKRAVEQARKEAEERTKKAKAEAEKVATEVKAGGSGGEGAPERKAEQLVGKEVVRFQGMRIAYFALDRESVLSCLEEKHEGAWGIKEGEQIILNRIVSLKEDSGKEAVAAKKESSKKKK
ncbi:glutaminyl-tRNA synthetase [Acaromyces ingoldii]|uniref:glutamine--tRNA ligase n=1 Tax=Acaromyces ingoldii TaxID=215250 RepID=A0A316YNU9_9BASI|nr:glutaminyl-tRNA synthetase [Acaromyces ingoldii]PWN90706.1 glutaminyl-tRNA synthetase [Acaromyces ingoldii]